MSWILPMAEGLGKYIQSNIKFNLDNHIPLLVTSFLENSSKLINSFNDVELLLHRVMHLFQHYAWIKFSPSRKPVKLYQCLVTSCMGCYNHISFCLSESNENIFKYYPDVAWITDSLDLFQNVSDIKYNN